MICRVGVQPIDTVTHQPRDIEAMMARLLSFESQQNYRAHAEGAWFEVIRGGVPVLLSAPHACMHHRDGAGKMEEEFTGAIARYVAEVTGCYAITATHMATEDPNWQIDSAYKRAIAALHNEVNLRFVVDLHGMLNRHQMGIAVGTMLNRSCQHADIVPAFAAHGFTETPLDSLSADATVPFQRRLVVNHPRFTGGVRNHTVTRFASDTLGIPAVQIELASIARVVYSPPTDDWPQAYTGDKPTIASAVHSLQALTGNL
jgi:hypothetical protein